MTDSEDVKNIKKYIDDRIWETENSLGRQFVEIDKKLQVIRYLVALILGSVIGLSFALNKVLNFWN